MMGDKDIAFPHLNIYLTNVPKSFSVFGFQIAIYGCLIATGILLGLCLASYDRKSRGLNPDAVWDCALYGIIASIIGARIYYVIFSWDNYKDNLMSVFNIRQGGLAIYGGVIAAFITVFIVARAHKEPVLELFDSIALGFPVGQAIGRWGNFFNREAFGDYTDDLLAMRFPLAAVRSWEITDKMKEHITEGVNYIQVHPTFLYECLWSCGLLLLLFLYRKHKKFSGEVFFLYLMGYGAGRIWIEALRTDQLKLPVIGMPVSQVVAGSCIIVSLAVIIFFRIKKGREKSTVTEQ